MKVYFVIPLLAAMFVLSQHASYANDASSVDVSSDSPVNPARIVLVSWATGSSLTFVLLSEERYLSLGDKSSLSAGRDSFQKLGLLRNTRELEWALTKIPKGSVISWRQYSRAQTTYPSKTVIEYVKKIAEEEGLKLEVAEQP